jgi:hypothetical protein
MGLLESTALLVTTVCRPNMNTVTDTSFKNFMVGVHLFDFHTFSTINMSPGSGESCRLRLEGDEIMFRRIFKIILNLTTRKTLNSNGNTCPLK